MSGGLLRGRAMYKKIKTSRQNKRARKRLSAAKKQIVAHPPIRKPVDLESIERHIANQFFRLKLAQFSRHLRVLSGDPNV